MNIYKTPNLIISPKRKVYRRVNVDRGLTKKKKNYKPPPTNLQQTTFLFQARALETGPLGCGT